MNPSTETERLAVCSWSLLPTNPDDLAAKLLSFGIHRVQLALDPLRESTSLWGNTESVLDHAGIGIVSGMFGCVGEDYSTLDSIRRTGGIVPDATWDTNLKNVKAIVPIAAALGLRLVTFHAGFVPHDPATPDYQKMLRRLATISELFAKARMEVGLETGQETADELATLLDTLQCPNVVVNFDPANMLLYGKGDPIQALRVLKPWIRQVHIKDATPSPIPGAWGNEVPVGSGGVDWPAFFAALRDSEYTGDFVIEREAGSQRLADISLAREVVLKSLL